LFDYVRNVPVPALRKVVSAIFAVLCTPEQSTPGQHVTDANFSQLSLMLDIARGIKYLHEHKPPVIHRDCKSSNILITSKVTAKIADFGLAKVKQSTRSMVRSLVGTVNWQAPELWHAHPKYDYKVDVYSCACVFWEMMQWHLPSKKYPWEVGLFGVRRGVGAEILAGNERACDI
jgi:serine/threonine protein kinase